MLSHALRITTTRRAPYLAAVQLPHFAAVRGIASSAVVRKDPGEGMGKKESIGGDNPISARAKGVGKAAKGVAEGVAGAAEAAVGVPEKDRKNHAGFDSRNVHEQEQDKGKREGLAHKGEQQGAV
ncbi:hypothetical protein JCM11251_000974 [Rhodosporidiobolus azoricus]